jgi:hypothetical protein
MRGLRHRPGMAMRHRRMRETDLVAQIRRLNAGRAPGLVEGIGDDCAILRPKSGEDLLVTTDFLLEGVHFHSPTHTAADCGWKALARGLSDIAAMGGTPRYAFVSLALAPWAGLDWLRGFYRGLNRLARRHGVVVAGGDLSEGGKAGLRHRGSRRGETRARAAPQRGQARRQALRHRIARRFRSRSRNAEGPGMEAPSAARAAHRGWARAGRASRSDRLHGLERWTGAGPVPNVHRIQMRGGAAWRPAHFSRRHAQAGAFGRGRL